MHRKKTYTDENVAISGMHRLFENDKNVAISGMHKLLALKSEATS